MAVGYGHVYHIESCGQYDPNNNFTFTCIVDFTSFGSGLQFYLRNFDTGRTIYKMVFGGDIIGFDRCDPDCYIWGYS